MLFAILRKSGEIMTDIENVLKNFPRLSMSLLPTPIQRLEKVSEKYSLNIYCKRDDLTGFAFGGNKSRKLDYLLADAINKNADTVIAIGANQSNFCRMAAASAIANNLDVHLVLGGDKPEKPTGNLLLDHLFGATIHHIGSYDWSYWEKEAVLLKKELEELGKNVYRLPVGGSTPVGALGYVSAFSEIINYCKESGISFDKIIHASSSGGTQAGLIVGKELSVWPGKIVGIGVAKSKGQLSREIYNLACSTGSLLHTQINKENIIVDNAYMGAAYGARTDACERAIELFAKNEGILLDHVYTGKAAAALIDYAERGLFNNKENVLFIHTGGNIQLFE